MKEPENIFQFITNVCKFINQNIYTSGLKVDEFNDVSDIDGFYHDACNSPGGLMAGMQNDISELAELLEGHYLSNNCKKELKRLQLLRTKFKF